jgi:phytoene dehydrogenase-like protein
MAGRHCVVIGAGLAGLAAAFRLLQNGWTVDVLESDDKRVGGAYFHAAVRSTGPNTTCLRAGRRVDWR